MTARERIAAYRSRHTINPVPALSFDVLPTAVDVCGTDGIRVHRRRGGWVHDPVEVRDAASAALEGAWA